MQINEETVELIKPGAGRVRCLKKDEASYKSRGFLTEAEYAKTMPAPRKPVRVEKED